jgi:Ni/Co efflux regulator RcnB
MKRTVMAAMVLSLLTGSAVALADPPQGYDHDHDRQDQRHDEHHDRGEHRGEMRHQHEEHGHWNSGRYERPHGWYAHHWRRGERLPPGYRASAYIIPDPVVYRLRPPPPGYYWVRVDNNAVLAAVATGVVLDVSVNLFH